MFRVFEISRAPRENPGAPTPRVRSDIIPLENRSIISNSFGALAPGDGVKKRIFEPCNSRAVCVDVVMILVVGGGSRVCHRTTSEKKLRNSFDDGFFIYLFSFNTLLFLFSLALGANVYIGK